jgi:hypothetical protein
MRRSFIELIAIARRFFGAKPPRHPVPVQTTEPGRAPNAGAPFGLVCVGHCELGGGWIYLLGVHGEARCFLWCSCCEIVSTGAVSEHLKLVGDIDSLAPNGLRVPSPEEVESILRTSGAERCVAPDGIGHCFEGILHKFK